MTIIIRNALGEIKTFMETDSGTLLEAGETREETAMPFSEYARRLRLLVDGRGGELIRVPAGSGTVTVAVECPGESTVRLNVNGLAEDVPLTDGRGMLLLSAEQAGTFVITPADRVMYCAAGEAVCVVEVAG